MNNLNKSIVITPAMMKNEFGYNGSIKDNRKVLITLLNNHGLNYNVKQIQHMNQAKNQVCQRGVILPLL